MIDACIYDRRMCNVALGDEWDVRARVCVWESGARRISLRRYLSSAWG